MKINFDKSAGLVPAIIQDNKTLQVLMLGYMNEDAYQKTVKEQKVTFFSRSKNRLWTKGETSGSFLIVQDIRLDCDNDSILIKATPQGPTCHTGQTSCFSEETPKGFLYQLQEIIAQRIENDADNSYTNKLFKKGINKVAQKLGEEAVELIIEAKDDNEDLFKGEAADLLYHFMILLKMKGLLLEDIESVLKQRSQPK
jgi:phosphoribosyl-AMP cyclohydrolase / phosphoribosyl-ATP pyrophosphohydrolase